MGEKDGRKKSNEAENSNGEMPLGLSFGMAMNEDAMEHFAGMSKAEKKHVMEEARQVRSRAEMDTLIRNVADGKVK